MAIADDIGAVLVLAIGYTEPIHLLSLVFSLVGIGFFVLLLKAGVGSQLVCLLMGIFIRRGTAWRHRIHDGHFYCRIGP